MKLGGHLSLLFILMVSMMGIVAVMAKAKDAGAMKSIVSELISQNKVVIFSKSHCPFCRAAKTIFDQMGEQYLNVELDKRGRHWTLDHDQPYR